jgi:MoaA/NifB/PqqE/SkfB family radical SAM enzyme
MNSVASTFDVAKALVANPRIITLKPSLTWFLCQYLRKFKVRRVGRNLIIHSHLPPLNSNAYSRFINEHLLVKDAGPSHAQIGITNLCPQNCTYCYNKNRSGEVLDTAAIRRLVQDLKRMGVFWIGLTGGEPLMNKEIAEIVASAGDGCAVKLFTTGCTLTKELAADLRRAGLFSVSVSLDHWKEEEHDRVRGYKGAFRAALNAVRVFQDLGGIDVGVSAVLSMEMIRGNQVEEFLGFLQSLKVHEAWLSEAKPSVPELWDQAVVITDEERRQLVDLQDRYNRQGAMTVNYLGHFEGKEHFGCCAGHKMLYVDAFGYVSPCVFTPMTFGNVRERPIEEIFAEMRSRFPTESRCFINQNFPILQKHHRGEGLIGVEQTRKLMEEVRFTPYARFFRLHYGQENTQ